MMLDATVLDQAARVLQSLRTRGWMVATAESCTGGLIAASLTAIAGSSDVVDRGFVTYSNEAKAAMLGVDPAEIVRCGAVSEPVARAMAQGAVARSNADVAVAVTGVAGPGGGSAEKPVGLVWFAVATRAGVVSEHHLYPGDRAAVRAATVVQALAMLNAAAVNAQPAPPSPAQAS